jgi:Sulfotransferase family
MTQQASAAFRFTFLHGVRIRSGTNYLGKVMGCNPHLQLVPPNTTTEEFPVLRVMDSWEKAFAEFLSRYKGSRSDYEFRRFLPHLGSAWLNYLVENFSLQPGHVFLKDPSVRFIDRFFDVFPEAKLILLVRDGRDNVASTVKAGLAVRTHSSLLEQSRKRLNHLMMRDFRAAARDWSLSVDKIDRASQYMIIRYEDVYQNPRLLAERMFTFMQVPFDDAILRAVENADVVGSSFYSSAQREDAQKPNWTATPRTEAFRPIGRWKGWSSRQKRLFKRVAGSQLISMGYEKDPSWD